MSRPGRVLITGTTSGLGLALLRAYAGAEQPLVAVNRRATPELAAEYPRVRFVVADISDAAAVDRLLGELARDGEIPDTFILNAGINEADAEAAFALEPFERVMRTNLSGALSFVQGVQRRGLTGRTLVGISSTSTIVPSSSSLGYYISKLALNETFALFRRNDPANDYRIVVLGPTATRLNRNLTPPAGLQGRLFAALTVPAEAEAARIARFVHGVHRKLGPPLKTRLFYGLVRLAVCFVPGLYYRPRLPGAR